MSDSFKGLYSSLYKTPDMSDIAKQMSEGMEEVHEAMEETQREKEKYKQEMLQTLKNIESNTAGLNEVVPLLASNLDKQDEILEVLKEALSISASKNQEEAKSKWRKVMEKTSQLTTDIESIQKIQGFANTIWQMYQNTGI
ncbi:rubrerythrin [Virgibacillus halotolerans]|uniref:hypothetical protein n=1 Tax=Virgibacillus halotolerans TaxID=1071053 RepID=UPI00195FB37E|nr:hypothetical protein [Virgibacillus halotolerans]MBM7598459.1 rubrerythrin [Virgibacillus halotolerans]